MNPNFYKEFEDKFRGPRELIKKRLQVYLPFIEPLKTIYPDVHAIDLGCGRGEWLEIMGENGFSAQGVDLDDGMLATCRAMDFHVHTGEALSFLKNLDNESQAIVTGFHLVEHMSFDDLLLLVKEALRVLKPAGILILETPNPENIVVGSSLFYTDPTHYRPIPLELLMFIVENNGFGKVKNLRLQETPEPVGNKTLSLLSVLNGVSPDYAVVAQKQADSGMTEKFSEAFTKSYGHNLIDMATKYDSDLLGKIAEAIDPLRQKNITYDDELSRIGQKNREHDGELGRIKQKIFIHEEELNRIGQKKSELEDELTSVYASYSWRCTKPMRRMLFYLKRLGNFKIRK